MTRPILAIALVVVLVLAVVVVTLLTGFTKSTSQLEPTEYVNPFIGTAPGGSHFGLGGDNGDTFPGAVYPVGMVQWSPDTTTPIPGGYFYSDSVIKGFSLTHFSGRGCPAYQDIPFMPYVGAVTASLVQKPLLYRSHFSHSNEYAHPGYYQVHLDSPNVGVELSVTARTGMGRFTYPSSNASTMLINAGGSVNGTTRSGVTMIPASHEVTGFATSRVGCGSNPYTVYFAARFDRAFARYGTWNADSIEQSSLSSVGAHSGAYITFDTTTTQIVQVQVGISFVSVANAQVNLTAEDAHFNFDVVRQRANAAWNNHLQAIGVQGGTTAEKTVFYTALYHTLIHPNVFSDANRQYLGFDNKVHVLTRSQGAQYENITGWDNYRSLIPLLSILFPSQASDIAQSLVNDAVQGDGHLPRWEQANVDSHGMNGDDGSVIIAEAYAFGARNFDTHAALTAMLQGQAKIREGYSDYLKLGYVAAGPTDNSADITQEYTVDDFAIARFAHSLGDNADYQLLLQRSSNWRHLFNTSSGYIEPRNRDGSWIADFSPTSGVGFQEGDSAQYTWMEPFNLHDLFTAMGGNTTVVSRLNHFFTQLNEGPTSAYAFMGNEPSFEVPWEYDFADAPSHTQSVVRRIQMSLFNATPAGLPGNDDGGAMSSWYIFSAMGLYPEISGVGGFVIGSPFFSSITLHLENGQSLHINAPAAADGNPYVQNMQLNGKATAELWLPWSSVQQGVTIDFSLGNNPTSWGNNAADAPPSYASVST